ncbi:MAG: GNAT family N-acetyltransferase [Candidatus Kapaibacterium sp.]
MSQILIRELQSEDSFVELTDLLHEAYIPLTKKGVSLFAATQTEEHTRERVRRAYVTFLGFNEGKMVATISLYKAVPDHRCEHYRKAWWFGQFAVHPEMQRTGIGSQLIELVEQRATNEGASMLALDTAETARDLIAYYTKRGYVFVQHQQWPDMKHRSVIMSKEL